MTSAILNVRYGLQPVIHLSILFVTYSPSGLVEWDVTIPDTTTTWVMQAVAINNKTGLGIATPLRIVGFREYFTSLKLPYSVKRGEQVSLLATVFNYHDQEMRVSVEKNLFFMLNFSFCSILRHLKLVSAVAFD